MPDPSLSPTSSSLDTAANSSLSQFTAAELAQALLEKLAIAERDWHRLKSNRTVRANEQAAAAIVFLLKAQPDEALPRLQQAVAWLDRSISAPPCPSHGDRARGKE